jgi:hypothetical protein
MNPPAQNSALKCNTILWLLAMILPAVFNIAFASTKFPWPVVLPLLLVGPMLASNKMVSRAAGKPADSRQPD